MYPKAITEEIVHDWARGASAEETKEHLRNKYSIAIGLATIYRHRHSLTAQNLIDELIRQQERAILKADTDNPEVAMRYRNELLKILLPTRIEATTHNIEETRNVTILADYTQSIRDAAQRDIQSLRAKQQVDTPPTNTETS